MQRCLGILLFLVVLIGCKEGPPEGILKKDVMTNVLYDIHVFEGYLYTSTTDSMRQRTADFNEGIYQHYLTDSATVRESLNYYASRPQVLQEIYNEIQNRLQQVEDGFRVIEDERYRSAFQTDSIRRAATADSLRRIENDSIRMQRMKNLIYWKDSDSIDLKPKSWSWENDSRLPLLHGNDFEIKQDTSLLDTLRKPGMVPVPSVE